VIKVFLLPTARWDFGSIKKVVKVEKGYHLRDPYLKKDVQFLWMLKENC